LPEYDETFQVIEHYDGLTIQYLSVSILNFGTTLIDIVIQYSKIGKVMKKISQLPETHIPDGDGQFKFRERAAKLVNDWHQILNAKANEGEIAETVNGTAEMTDAAPSAPAVDGDVSIMTDA
jgi:TFIIS helical bundle-like domain